MNMPTPSCLGRLILVSSGTLLLSSTALLGQTWNGGGGDNFWTDGTNWQGGSAPLNNGTAAIVFNGSTRTTPDLDADYSVGSVQLIAGAGSFTLNSSAGHTLTIGGLLSSGDTTAASPRNPMVNPQTVNVALALSADTLVAGVDNYYYHFTSLTLNGPINTAGYNLSFSAPAISYSLTITQLPIQINGVISGAGGIATSPTLRSASYSDGGELILTAANTYTGTTKLTGSRVLALTGDSAALAGTAGISINNSTQLLVGDAASTAANPNRINDKATLTMNRGEFVLTGSNNAATTRETIGTVILGGASGVFTLQPATSSGQAELVSTAALVRSAGATALVRGTNLGADAGANTTRFFLGTAPELVGGGGAAGSQNISIVPYLSGGTSSTDMGSTLVTYGANGLRPLNTSTEFAPTLAAAVGSPSANVRLTASETLSGSQSINALVLSGGLVTIAPGSTLTVGSGAILAGNGGTPSNLSTAINGGTLNFGAAEGVLTAPTGYLGIGSVITGSGGLTLGTGSIALSGANTYTGTTSISTNTTLSGFSPLGASGPGNGTVVHPGGTLGFNGQATTVVNDDIQFIGSSVIQSLNRAFPTFNGNLTIGDGATPGSLGVGGGVIINGNIRSTQTAGTVTLSLNNEYSSPMIAVNGVISDTGAAPLAVGIYNGDNTASPTILTGANTYRGGTTVAGGTLAVNNTAGSGTGAGDVVISAAKNTSNKPGLLAGTGHIDPANGAVVQNYGTISPGNVAIGGSVGNLTIGSEGSENELQAYSASTLIFHFGGSTSDKLTIFGNLTLEGPNISLSLVDLGNTVPGVYTLITYTGTLNGPFGDLALSTNFRGTLVNDIANHSIDYVFVSVPEPSAAWLIGLCGVIGVGWLRCRCAIAG